MGLFANLFMGGAAKDASRKAAKAQTAAMQQGIGQQGQILGQVEGYYDPYRQFGAEALGQYGDLLGTNGAAGQQAAIEALRNSPYFKALYGQGEEAVLQNASATGGLRGGNTQRSLYELGENTLAQTIQQQLANLTGGVNMGYGTAGALGSAAMGTGNNITDLLVGQGQAKAQDILTRGAIDNSFWGGLGSLALNGAGMALGIPGMGSMGGGGGNPLSGLLSKLMGGGNAAVGMGMGGGGYIPSPQLGELAPTNFGTSPLSMGSGFANFSVPSLAG